MKLEPTVLVDAWNRVREARIDVFSPSAATAIAELPGLGALAGAHEISPLAALQALALATNEASAGKAQADLVVSMPSRIRGLLRTSEVARALVQAARREILVIGYELRDEPLRKLLEVRGSEGIEVTVVGNRVGGGARTMLRDWPAANRPLTALENVEPAQGEHCIMHGKVIVADRLTALIGSANFTFSGLNTNFEFGVRVAGPIAADIVTLVERLQKQSWLQRITLG